MRCLGHPSEMSQCYLKTRFASQWVSANRHNQAKIRRRKDLLLLAASKENAGDLSQNSVSLNSKIGEVLS